MFSFSICAQNVKCCLQNFFLPYSWKKTPQLCDIKKSPNIFCMQSFRLEEMLQPVKLH